MPCSWQPDRMAVPDEIQRVFHEWEARDRCAQASVPWQRDRWIDKLPQLTPLFEALPPDLDRGTVRAFVSSRPITPQGMFDAMVAVYAWGWSTSPVGVLRARRVLLAGHEVVGGQLLAARARVLEAGALEGYWALARAHRVPGLGPAFGTKFLYFASADEGRALIFDKLVSDWLRGRVDIRIPPARWVRSGYEYYLAFMQSWADELSIDAHVLEELVFTDEASRRGLQGWAHEAGRSAP